MMRNGENILKLDKFSHNNHSSGVKMLVKFIRRGIWVEDINRRKAMMFSLSEIFFVTFGFIFNFWFVLVFTPLQNKKNGIKSLIYFWTFLAIIRILLFFNSEPTIGSYLIPEPLNTILFFVTGFVLITTWFIWNFLKFKKMKMRAFGLSAKDLLDLSPGEFEEMTAELFRALGYQANKTGAIGDHGVDVIVKSKDGRKMIVQCKRWRKPVGEPIVREFYGAMQHEKAAHGTIFATSGFTQQAIEWAKGKPMSLYNGEIFISMWQKAKKSNTTRILRRRIGQNVMIEIKPHF